MLLAITLVVAVVLVLLALLQHLPQEAMGAQGLRHQLAVRP
jgi:preprotein translocase subunit SecG